MPERSLLLVADNILQSQREAVLKAEKVVWTQAIKMLGKRPFLVGAFVKDPLFVTFSIEGTGQVHKYADPAMDLRIDMIKMERSLPKKMHFLFFPGEVIKEEMDILSSQVKRERASAQDLTELLSYIQRGDELKDL